MMTSFESLQRGRPDTNVCATRSVRLNSRKSRESGTSGHARSLNSEIFEHMAHSIKLIVWSLTTMTGYENLNAFSLLAHGDTFREFLFILKVADEFHFGDKLSDARLEMLYVKEIPPYELQKTPAKGR